MEFVFIVLLLPLFISFIMSTYLFIQYIRFKDFQQEEFIAYRMVWLGDEFEDDEESEIRYVVLDSKSSENVNMLSSPSIERKLLTDFEKSSFDKIMKQLDPYD